MYLEDNLTFESVFGDLSGLGALLNVVVNGTFTDADGDRALGFDYLGNAYVADGRREDSLHLRRVLF